MKYFTAVFNMVAVGILLIMFSIFDNHIQIAKRDFDSARLQTAIDNAGRAAFDASLRNGNIGGTWEDLDQIALDPTNTLDAFAGVMCASYNMAVTEANKAIVIDSIDTAVLCNNDGYYITVPSKVKNPNTDNNRLLGSIDFELKWSMKLPYTYQIPGTKEFVGFNLQNSNLRIYNADGGRVGFTKGVVESTTVDNITTDKFGVVHHYSTTEKEGTYWKLDGSNYSKSDLNDAIKLRAINNRVADAMNYSIAQAAKMRAKGLDFNVYIPPASVTDSGINSIKGTSFLVVLSGAEYAGKANLKDATMNGMRAVSKAYIIGFRDIDGEKRYCYEGQLPPAIRDDADSVLDKFINVREAARAGYKPAYDYLVMPLDRK